MEVERARERENGKVEKGARKSFILPTLVRSNMITDMEAPPQHGVSGLELLQAFAVYLHVDTKEVVKTLLQSVQLPAGATVAQGA